MFNVVFSVKQDSSHLAAWLCIGLKFIRRDRGVLLGGCCLFYPVPAGNVTSDDPVVRATGVMVNRGLRGIFKLALRYS